jgi:predicted RNA-binding protein YlxR (DUF448 family)
MPRKPRPATSAAAASPNTGDVGPVRSCGACRVRCGRLDLLHFVVAEGRVAPDPARRGTGRGLNLGPAYVCLERAVQRQVFTRGLGAQLPEGGIDGLARRFVTEAADWLEATLATALARGGAERVATLSEITPPPLRLAFEARPLWGDPSSDAHALGALPWLRVTSPRLARRVSSVAAALSEFTTTLAGDTTRRPRLAKACGVLGGAPDERRAHDAQRERSGARGHAGRPDRSAQVVEQDEQGSRL